MLSTDLHTMCQRCIKRVWDVVCSPDTKCNECIEWDKEDFAIYHARRIENERKGLARENKKTSTYCGCILALPVQDGGVRFPCGNFHACVFVYRRG